jgi:hypothetical protein
MYFLQLGFHPLAVAGSLVQNRNETAQKEKQYTKQHKTIQKHSISKTENKNTKQEHK